MYLFHRLIPLELYTYKLHIHQYIYTCITTYTHIHTLGQIMTLTNTEFYFLLNLHLVFILFQL